MYYRLIALLALPGLLSGCSVYDHFAHPHRLGTPPMTSSAKAKARAADKARHKGLTLGNPDEAKTDGSADGAAAPAPADTHSADDKNKAIAEMLGNTYDKKTGLLKRSKLQRMQYSSHALHHYDLSAPKHTDVAHDERKMRKYRKHPKDQEAAPEPPPRPGKREPAPAPDPTQPAAKIAPSARTVPAAKAAPTPAATPTPPAATEPPAAAPPSVDTPDEPPLAPRSNPGKFQTEKKSKKKDRKAPRPDPTQPDGTQ